jgi:hypothetical protein
MIPTSGPGPDSPAEAAMYSLFSSTRDSGPFRGLLGPGSGPPDTGGGNRQVTPSHSPGLRDWQC